MKLEIEEYPGFKLKRIEATSVDDVPFADSREYSRVEIPFNPKNISEMGKKGYIFADRTIGVEISLKRSKIDYQRMIRFEIKRVNSNNDAIQQIALKSFPADRRFHIRPIPDQCVADSIIRKWIGSLSEIYACIHKEQIVGFLDLESFGEKNCFIHLAAVREKYRATGAAVSLYAYAALVAKEKSCEKVCGRISSSNTAVMNLYALLGGIFGSPMDIFVRSE